jgi:hypothetical protein
MNYQTFTNDSLTMMYEAIRGALAADDALKRQGLAIRFRVRETPDWKNHAAESRFGNVQARNAFRGYRLVRRSADGLTRPTPKSSHALDSITRKAMGLGESPVSHARRTVLCRENCADRWTTPRR